MIKDVLTFEVYSNIVPRLGVAITNFDITPSTMTNYSNFKYGIFPALEETENITKSDLSDMLIALYLNKWQRIISALTAEYNPIHNYDRTETHTSLTDHGKTTTITTPNGGTVIENTQTGTVSTVQVIDVATYNGMTKQRETVTTTPTPSENYKNVTKTVAETGTKNETVTEHDKTVANHFDNEYEADEIRSESVKTSGNIGVTTSQQMIESEIMLRYKYSILEIIVGDCANFVCGGGF